MVIIYRARRIKAISEWMIEKNLEKLEFSIKAMLSHDISDMLIGEFAPPSLLRTLQDFLMSRGVTKGGNMLYFLSHTSKKTMELFTETLIHELQVNFGEEQTNSPLFVSKLDYTHQVRIAQGYFRDKRYCIAIKE